MSTQEIQEKAQAYCKEHNIEEVHATTDGQLFEQKCFADLHAKSLKTKSISIIRDVAAEASKEEAPEEIETPKVEEVQVESKKEEAEVVVEDARAKEDAANAEKDKTVEEVIEKSTKSTKKKAAKK